MSGVAQSSPHPNPSLRNLCTLRSSAFSFQPDVDAKNNSLKNRPKSACQAPTGTPNAQNPRQYWLFLFPNREVFTVPISVK
jgi:hypothetical protein